MSNANDSILQLKSQILAAFECQKSGNCCRRDGYVYATLPEMQKMADFLEVDLGSFMDRFVKRDSGWWVISSVTHRPNCFLTPENTCRIYPVRPPACKTYPHWPDLWVSKESILAEIAMCPGLKKAVDSLTSPTAP
jgi:Fe-S-cluster containining protein